MKQKKIYRLKEMIEMGYPTEYCRNLLHIPGQKFAWKEDPKKINSPVLVDYEEFLKFREGQIRMSAER